MEKIDCGNYGAFGVIYGVERTWRFFLNWASKLTSSYSGQDSKNLEIETRLSTQNSSSRSPPMINDIEASGTPACKLAPVVVAWNDVAPPLALIKSSRRSLSLVSHNLLVRALDRLHRLHHRAPAETSAFGPGNACMRSS